MFAMPIQGYTLTLFGKLIRQRRKELGYSQEIIAENVLGNRDRKGHISQIENAKIKHLSDSEFNRIAQFLDIDVEEFEKSYNTSHIRAVVAKLGVLKENRVDLTALPISGKLKTMSEEGKQNREDIEWYGLPEPASLESETFPRGQIGTISKLLSPIRNSDQSQFVVYATTSNEGSSVEAIIDIGKKLGELTQEFEEIRIVEAPFLGTGKGKLRIDEAIKAISVGFQETRHKNAVLILRHFTQEVVDMANAVLRQSAETVPDRA